jgi:hypothetical protein
MTYFEYAKKRNDAGVRVQRAIYKKILVKPSTCSACRQEFCSLNIHGHHDDYDKPLNVIWLCPTCHKRRHKTMGIGSINKKPVPCLPKITKPSRDGVV